MSSRNDLERKYPRGTKLRLTKPIEDPYTPKQAGDIFVVDYADGQNQLHGHWENGGSMALIVGYDEFEIIE